MKVCVIGATGAVGREMVADLADSGLDVDVYLYASSRSEAMSLDFRGRMLRVKEYSLDAASSCHYALMSAGGDFSRANSPQLAAKGIVVIDNSSAWRMDPEVPLVVPEVNRKEITGRKPPRGIIANPNCTTIQLVVALVALKEKFGIEQVIVSSYQSVSGTGQKGIAELAGQVQGHFRFQEPEPQVYRQPIAFNLLPAIDRLDVAGHCFEEEKIVRETRRILGMPGLPVLASTVRTPTFHCHGEAVSVRLGRTVSLAEAKAAFSGAEGISFVDAGDIADMPTPRKVAGDRSVWVSRARLPIDQDKSDWLQFWVIADNLKKGAATNAVQILETLIKGGARS